MAQFLKATAGTDAITDGNQVEFTLNAKHFNRGMRPVISIKGLAGAETVSFWKKVDDDFEELDDGSGTQIAYTATYAADVFNGPGRYGFTKDATVSSISLYVDDGR